MSTKRITLLGIAGVIPIILALWIAGFDINYQLGNYVISDSAVVAGDLVQAPSPAAGQVTELLSNVGDRIQTGQPLVVVTSSPAGGAAPAGAAAPAKTETRVRAPADGTLVFMTVTRGQAITQGQAVAVLADLSKLWLVANVDETSFRSIRPGLRAEVYLPAFDTTFPGQVVEILPAAAGLAGSTSAGIRPPVSGATKTTPQVPVKIAFDYNQMSVLPGMSATIKIFIRG